MDPEREHSLRAYAACAVSWRQLQWEHGFDSYYEVLAGLGELGLSPPIRPMTGPEAEEARAMLHAHLASVANGEYTPVQWPPEVQAATRQFIADEEAKRQRRDLEEIKAAIEHGREQAERGEGMTVAEAKERTMAAILSVQVEMVDSLVRKHNVDISPALMAEVEAQWPKD